MVAQKKIRHEGYSPSVPFYKKKREIFFVPFYKKL
jgi:hypothetical protein